jgi:cobalt-zinc-cadmium efflux system protein
MSNDDISCTAHVTLAGGAAPDEVRSRVVALLDQQFEIGHATVQTEGPGEECEVGGQVHP